MEAVLYFLHDSAGDPVSREECSKKRRCLPQTPPDTETSEVKQGLHMAKAESKRFISHLKIIIT